ncbi:MAG: substrate-binding domain-containing protein, partial [[Clostridium] innocuum]
DMTAFGIMAALIQQGCRIPQDYSVAGFDNIHLSSMPNISLTSIEHASILKGKEAVDMIYKKNNKDTRSKGHKYILRLEYEPELIIRKSTGKCRSQSK